MTQPPPVAAAEPTGAAGPTDVRRLRRPRRESTARTYAHTLPVVPLRARGLTVEGADGRRYLDCLSGSGELVLGHNHPVVLEAIRSALNSGAPLHDLDVATPVRDAFTTELLRTLPPHLAGHAHVRFCGPSAAETADTVRDLTGAADAVIVEPVCGEEEVAPVLDSRLRTLHRLATARGLPFVVDETRTGVGRTGAFWAVEHSGVVPDALVAARTIGGSLPLAVVVHRVDVGSPRPPGPGSGRGGNQLAMAAGAATLAYVRTHRLAERAATLGDRMLRHLRRFAAQEPCIAGVRGRGLMIGVDLAAPGFADNDPAAPEVVDREAGSAPRRDARPGEARPSAARALAAAVRQQCLRRGLIVGVGQGPGPGVPTGPGPAVGTGPGVPTGPGPAACVGTGSGRRGAVTLRLTPPLTITDEQADAVLDRLSDAIVHAARSPHFWYTAAPVHVPSEEP